MSLILVNLLLENFSRHDSGKMKKVNQKSDTMGAKNITGWPQIS